MNVRKTQLRVNMVYMFIKGNDKEINTISQEHHWS